MGDDPIVLLLTYRDLRHRATRFAVVTVLGGVIFALLFVMTGLVEQFRTEPVDTIDALGAESWILAPDVLGPFNAGTPLPASLRTSLGDIDAVPIVVGGAALGLDDDEPVRVSLVGVDPAADLLRPPAEGRPVRGPGEIVVDVTTEIGLGETVVLGTTTAEVVGRSKRTTVFGGLPLAFVDLETAQVAVFGTTAAVTGFAAPADAVAPDGVSVRSRDDVIEATSAPLDDAVASVDLVRALLWFVAAVIIGAVVYLSALERQRDFAVLKAVGVSTRTLLGSLAIQAVLIALGAVAIGILIQSVLAPTFPMTVRVPARALVQIPVAGVVMAVVAGSAGLRRVAGADPASAFAGAGR